MILILPQRMTDVLSRIRFNLHAVLEGSDREPLESAAATCVRCGLQNKCDKWIASHREGEDNPPPDFCPNAAFNSSHGSVPH